MSLWKRSLGGMLSGAGSIGVKTGLNLLLVPMLIATLGLDAFGLYVLLIALLELAVLLDLGLTSALVTLLGGQSPADAEGSSGNATSTERAVEEGATTAARTRKATLAAGHLVFILLTLLVLAAGLTGLPDFARQFHIQPALRAMARSAALLTLLEAALTLYGSYARALLLTHCANQWTNVADTLYYFIANVGGLLLLLAGFDLTAVMAARLAGAVLRQGLMTVFVCRLEPLAFRHGFSLRLGDWKPLFRLGGHAMLLNISIILSHKVDSLIIAHFLPLSAVAAFEIVFRLLGVANQIAVKLSEVAFPLFARMAAECRRDDARRLFLRMSALLYLIAALMTLAIVCHYPELLRLFSSGRITPAQTLPVLLAAIPCMLSGVLQMTANAWLFTWGHRNYLTVTSLLVAAGNVGLSLLLVQWLGILGVALGTLIPQLIQHQAGLIRNSCRELGISAGQYLKAVHGTMLVPLGAAFLWIQLFAPWIHAMADADRLILLPIALASGGAMLLGLAVWFLRTASPEERTLLREQILLPLQARLSSSLPDVPPRSSSSSQSPSAGVSS
jgi:O-antigen/teichoic acid export membrane protein